MNAYPYMEKNAERIEGLCREGTELCSDASDILLSCSGSFAYWDVLAQTGGEKHPEQLAAAYLVALLGAPKQKKRGGERTDEN